MRRRTHSHVQELKNWARQIRRDACPGVRNLLRDMRASASLPRSFLRAARKVLATYGDEVAGRHGVSKARQFAGMIEARVRWGLDPIACYRFRLYLDDRRQQAPLYLQTAVLREVLEWLVHATPGYPAVFRDKRAFDAWCAAHGLPSVPALMEFEDGAVIRGEAASLPRADLFSKPTNWEGGRGARRWTFDPERGAWRDASGRLHAREELSTSLAKESGVIGRPIILQRMLRNHASLARLSGDGLSTARVLTIREPGSHATLVSAAYRMPVAPAFADNFDLGGIAAPINAETGRIGPGIRKYPRVSGPMAIHPDTGATFAGATVPYWKETVDLALRAHDAIDWPSVPAVGWDVAVLDHGPVLLEGNNRPCSTLTQMAAGGPLGATSFVTCVNAHLRKQWNERAARGASVERGVVGTWVRRLVGS